MKITIIKEPLETDEPDNPKDSDNPDGLDNPEQPSEKLPQTGTYWWPVPILSMIGILFVAIGMSWWRHEE